MKLIYGGCLSPNGTCFHRMQALQRLGFNVHSFNADIYQSAGSLITQKIRIRSLIGRAVSQYNKDIVDLCKELKPDFIWLDKPVFLWPETVKTLRHCGAVVIIYICDNPFGDLFEPWFRLLRRTAIHCDVVVIPRPSSIADFTVAGAKKIVLTPFAFEPFNEFPDFAAPPPSTPLSFIGSPHDQRAAFFRQLAGMGVPVVIRGDRWERTRLRGTPNLTLHPPAWGENYRRAIQDSMICFSFVTHHNHDPYAHKSFEITACSSFLLAERSDGHSAMFEEGKEAEFFDGIDEAADKARFYLANPDRRRKVAEAGCYRSWTSGYSNDERLAATFAEIDPGLGEKLMARARTIITERRRELGLT